MTAPDDPTQNIEAEQSVLGAVLLDPRILTSLRELVEPGDFYQPRHTTIYAAMCRMADHEKSIDAVTLAAELTARGEVGKVGGNLYLHTLLTVVPTASNWGYYAGYVKNAKLRRDMVAIATRLKQLAVAESWLGLEEGQDAMLDLAAQQSILLQVLIDHPGGSGPKLSVQSWQEFVESAPPVRRWIVPDFLERQDVFMVLSAGGAGKSTLARQVCQSVAAGIHPFYPGHQVEPQTTLLLDFENPPNMVKRQTMGPMGKVERFAGRKIGGRGLVCSHMEGLDLRRRDHAQAFEAVIAEHRPALVAAGPLYNMFRRGRDDHELAAEETRDVFNRCRERYGVAFWIEHHMPRVTGGGVSGNPYGSTIWEKWPSFGRTLYSIAPGSLVYHFQATFRGDRDERTIPVGLRKKGEIAWDPIWDMEELEEEIKKITPARRGHS